MSPLRAIIALHLGKNVKLKTAKFGAFSMTLALSLWLWVRKLGRARKILADG
jgi:hypothetical protein